MRIVLINPPGQPGTTINREGAAGLGNCYPAPGAFLYPPQTLAGSAALLRAAGHAPALLDMAAEPGDTAGALDRVATLDPDVIVVLLSACAWECDLAFCMALHVRAPARPVITIGTILREPAYATRAADVSDLVLWGEPERALSAACERVTLRNSGVVLPAEELAPAEYEAGGYMREIETLPFPAWDLAPVARYRMLTLLTARGCGERCAYCPYRVGWGTRVRACSAGRVVDELTWLTERFRPPRVMFRDPAFAYDRARVVGICEALLRRGLKVAWECEGRPDQFDLELLRLMRRAGCVTLKLGLESGEPARLVALGRVADLAAGQEYLETARSAVAGCSAVGLRCHLFVLAGFPDETDAEVERTAALLGELGPAHLSAKAVERYAMTPAARQWPVADMAATERHLHMLLAAGVTPATSSRSLWQQGAGWLRRLLR